ncbi:MAG: hypothetical protein AB1424_01175 [Thermodesulfobacteriota bacterium]
MYPEDKTAWVDGVTELEAWWFNALENYVGVRNSDDPESLTYKLTNPQQVDPGHKHTSAAFLGGEDGHVFVKVAGAWSPANPDSVGLVTKAGEQSIDGKKTFTILPEAGADPILDNQLARRKFVSDGLAAKVGITNNETITGVKTFAALPLAQAGLDPTSTDHLVPRHYVDNAYTILSVGKMDKLGGQFTGPITFDGDLADRSITQDRRLTADTPGFNFLVQAGGAAPGATDKAGGTLKLQPGISTGTGESGVEVYGSPAGAAGTGDNALAVMLKVLGNKLGFFGVNPVARPAALTAQLATLTFVAPGMADYDIAAPIQNTGWGFTTADEFKTVMSVIANLQTRLGQLETRQQSLGLLS